MRRLMTIFLLAALFGPFFTAAPGYASKLSGVRYVLREAGEFLGLRTERAIIRETEAVATEKTAELFTRYGRRGRQVFALIGDDALKVSEKFGREGLEMCMAHSAESARFLAKHADESILIWRRFGREGTSLMVKYPGMARPLLEKCGRQGLAVAEKLSPGGLAKFTSLSQKLSRENLDIMITWTLKKGDEVIDFLWRNKVPLAAGASLYTLLRSYDAGSGQKLFDKDGRPVSWAPGSNFLQRQIDKITDHTLASYPWLPLLPLVFFLGIIGVDFRFVFRLFRKLTVLTGKGVKKIYQMLSAKVPDIGSDRCA